MPVTNSYDGDKPTVGADADAWGGIINAGLTAIKSTLDAICALLNSVETLVGTALQRAGGTMTGDLILSTGNQTSSASAGFRGAPIINLTSDAALSLGALGTTVRLAGNTGYTLTLANTSVIGYPLGAVVVVRCDDGTGQMTIARAAGVSLRVPGSSDDANRTLAANGLATLLHEAPNRWLIQGVGVGAV